MQHKNHLDEIRLDRCELTIGSYDGVHLGHQALLAEMVSSATGKNIPSVVLTFFPHPAIVLRGRSPSFYIDPPDTKALRLGELGIDYVVSHPFDKSLSRMRAEPFLRWLKDQLQFIGLWVGENFAFGYQREGNLRFLEEASSRFEFDLHVVPPVVDGGEVISSTRVREALRSGDVARVATYLGRPFSVPGVVERGSGRGKSLGFPTANLSVWDELAFPAPGVYACVAEVGARKLAAVTNIGVRPTFEEEGQGIVIEAHLLDYSGDLYGEEIKLSFIRRLREERKFARPEELLAQIRQDIQAAKKILSPLMEESSNPSA
jgi:riboflavin kinase/FMN adenylyltransferase